MRSKLYFCMYLILQIFLIVGAKNKDKCDSMSETIMKHLATKTPYSPQSTDDIHHDDCTPKQIWLLNRHGTRYPGKSNIKKWIERLPVLQSEIINASTSGGLCSTKLNNLKNWALDPSLNVSMASWLAEAGKEELFKIGQRFQSRFPNLFPKQFTNQSYTFRSTDEQRAIESGKSFTEGVFESSSAAYFPAPILNDPILHFYKNCDKWMTNVDNNPAAKSEPEKFAKSAAYLEVVAAIQNRLATPITSEDVELMYNACGSETALHPRQISPWCGVFSKDDLQVLEYMEDLEDYWMDGYGFPVSYEQACEPVKDLLNQFDAKINGGSTLASAYFAHSGTLLKLYARLGLFKDNDDLRSGNFEKMKKKRKWRTSKISTFASNIAFILFNCPKEKKEKKQYKIGVLVNEKKIKIPACDDKWICNYEKFSKHFKQVRDSCDLSRICKI